LADDKAVNDPIKEPEPKPRYKWPWFLLAAVVLGTVLFVVWVTIAAVRTRQMREPDLYSSPAQPGTK